MKHPYDDIIDLPHHVSPTRPRMSAIDRAAQFSPFAALTGYDAAIAETARLTGRRIELTDSARAMLDEKLRLIGQQLGAGPKASITYFQPDLRKSGGEYVTVSGTVKKIDSVTGQLFLTDGTRIPIEEVIEIDDSP